MVVYVLVLFIGWSYSSAMAPESAFIASFVGFTCGVGLCEEVCKALPLILYFRRRRTWGGAGRASGAWLPAGLRRLRGDHVLILVLQRHRASGDLRRQVRLNRRAHAMWSGAVGVLVWKLQETIRGDIGWGMYGLAVLRLVAVPMVLHGLYDTILKKDLDAMALMVGLLSFAWFAWQIESAREFEQKSPDPNGTSLSVTPSADWLACGA